ncbi:hypothetical protein MACH17_21330 [Phaeobacter inhibens]|uniref:hypothetical protein n=1 Tax=Phaeobacter inhibens TaxID=221822 RepID=UPI0027582B22|nr:hypothetical protein [Phaeobacter inhibens]GLO70616.1 hypothetical protein MACH17_21330 [Phaeobacter inhibens]
MMDERFLDQAERAVEAERAQAVQRVTSAVAGTGRKACLDCGDEIEPKRVVIDRIRTEAEMLNYVLSPRFGSVTKKTAHRFRVDCGGNWRTALELADTCARMMQANEIENLDHTVVETAAALMAGHA